MPFHDQIEFPGLHKAKFEGGLDADLPPTPEGFGDIYWAVDSNTIYLTNLAGDTWIALTPTGINQVAVTGADTTPGYLQSKIAAGTNITLTVLNPGANEQLRIAASLASIDASAVTYTPANNANWNGGTDPGNANQALDQLAARAKTLENTSGQSLVNGTDATFGYLEDKIVQGTNIVLTVLGTTNKTLEIAATGGGGGSDNDAQEMAWLGAPISGIITASRLGYSTLPDTQSTIYTAPANQTVRIISMFLHNTGGSDETVSFWAKVAGGTSRMVEYVVMPADSMFNMIFESPIILADGDELEAMTTTATTVTWVASGGVRTTPVSGAIVKHLADDEITTSGILYTVPVSTITTVSHIIISIPDDPSGGVQVIIDVVVGADNMRIFESTLYWHDVIHLYPKLILEAGDELSVYSASVDFAECWIDGAEAV